MIVEMSTSTINLIMGENLKSNLIYLIVGATFGFFSSFIGTEIKAYREKYQTKKGLLKGIFSEISYTCLLLLSQYMIISKKINKWEKKDLMFVKNIFDFFEESELTDIFKKQKEIFSKLSAIDERELAQIGDITAYHKDSMFAFPEFSLTYIKSNISKYSLLDDKLQTHILSLIRQEVNLNNQYKIASKFFYMTFDSNVKDESYKRLIHNVNSTYEFIKPLTINMINEILEIRKYLKNKVKI